jgi:hypothetical protein
MAQYIGPRFACIDLDVVLVNNVDHIFTRSEPFLIHEYKWTKKSPGQRYNGALTIMDAGAHQKVYDTFNPRKSPRQMAQDKTRVGSDQAWIDYCLPDVPTLGETDGIYEAAVIGDKLPNNACMVFFAGNRTPTTSRHPWIPRYH